MSLKNSALLPNGLKDLLPPEAEKEASVITLVMEEFSKFGYARVKPPLVEFEDSLLSEGPGKALAPQTFRLMDPVSRQMMGVRADTTAQIARIAGSRLADEARPLRLSYAADILRVNGSQLRPERQFCQVGCEMIGVRDGRDDVEMCLVAISALNKAQVKDLSIDLSIPVLVKQIFEAYDVQEDDCEILDKLLQKRDRDGLIEHGSDVAILLTSLLDASGVAVTAVEKLKVVKVSDAIQETLTQLIDVYHMLSDALKVYSLEDVNITIDLIERRGFEYKSGISFTLFSKNARGEVGRGGRYYVRDQEESVGFTLYMDSLLEAAQMKEAHQVKTVSSDASWGEIKDLQDQGYRVSRS